LTGLISKIVIGTVITNIITKRNIPKDIVVEDKDMIKKEGLKIF